MKKIEILERAEAELAGGNMTADMKSRYPRWLVRQVLSKGYDSILADSYEQYRQGIFAKDQFLLDNYTVTFTPTTNPPVVVQYDTERKRYYCDLPKSVLVLRHNEGIRLVCPVENEAGAGIPIQNTASVIRKPLTVSAINPRFTYTLEGTKRIWFTFPIVPYTALMIKMVVPFDELEDFDEVDEPAIMTKNGIYTLYNYVMENLLRMPITKQTENNNPTA